MSALPFLHALGQLGQRSATRLLALDVELLQAVDPVCRDFLVNSLSFHMYALSTDRRYRAVSFLPLVAVLPHVNLV